MEGDLKSLPQSSMVDMLALPDKSPPFPRFDCSGFGALPRVGIAGIRREKVVSQTTNYEEACGKADAELRTKSAQGG
jgi:hypothetical protein